MVQIMANKKQSKPHKNNLIIQVSNLKFDVNISNFIYSPDEIKDIRRIVRKMSRNIWLDRTYVHFRKTRWRDAYIKEKSWDTLCDLIVHTDFGENGSFYEDRAIMEAIIVLSLTYMYSILCKYGYDVQYIELNVKEDSKFKISYELDERTSWDF
jgi:hypothetical protein